jgi:hypothetical protein
MVAGQSALLDGPVNPAQFIEPLTKSNPERRKALLTLCGLYAGLALLILLTADYVSGHAFERMQDILAKGGEGTQPALAALFAEPQVAYGALLATGLGSMLSVPFWHAPALVHWGGQGARQALFSSTLAVWLSKGAFAAYMLAWAGLMIGFFMASAFLLALLGMPQMASLVLFPAGLIFSTVFYLSGLFTFTDSFGGTPSVAGPPQA